MSEPKKHWNKTLASMWTSKADTGHITSMPIDNVTFDNIKNALAAMLEDGVGGKLIVKKLTETTRQKFKNPDNAPHYFLEYIPKAAQEEFRNNPRGSGSQGL